MGGLPCVGDVRLGYDERGLAKRDAIAHLGCQLFVLERVGVHDPGHEGCGEHGAGFLAPSGSAGSIR